MAEPEWDDQTRDLALAHTAVNICPRCGGPAYLCQDPALQDSWKVPPPVRCHRTTVLRKQQRAVTEQTNPVTDALIWGTVLDEQARR